MKAHINERRRTRTQPTRLETLEQRRLMSAVLSSGVLTITGTPWSDRLEVDQGASDIYVFENGLLTRLFPSASVSRIVFRAGDGNDYLKAWPAVTKPTEMHGENHNDTIIGSNIGDYMIGGFGNDYIHGGPGNDSISGGEGNDTIYGFTGNDFISGVGGADSISAGAGNDTVYGDTGNDTLYGEADNDLIFGGSDDDFIGCSTGNDTVYGGWGHDRIYGEGGHDRLFGEDGNDTIHGGAGNDNLYGGAGNDMFYAFDNEWDWIDGGSGWDTAQCDKRPWYAPWQTKDDMTGVESSYE